MDFQTKFMLMLPEEGNNRWSAFNPSIAEAGDGSGYAMTIRSSNYIFGEPRPKAILTEGSIVQSRVWFARLSDDAENIVSLDMVKLESKITLNRGAEDPRLFWRDGRWMFIAGVMEPHIPVGRMTLWSLDEKKMTAKLEKIYSGRVATRVEKNWAPTTDGSGDFEYIYGPNIIYKKSEFIEVGSRNDLPLLRGGSQLLADGGGYLAVCHITYPADPAKMVFSNRLFTMVPSRARKYNNLFVRYDKSGKVTAMSPEFNFGLADIEYVSGLVRIGDQLVLSFGVDDKKSFIAKVSYKDVINSLVQCSYD